MCMDSIGLYSLQVKKSITYDTVLSAGVLGPQGGTSNLRYIISNPIYVQYKKKKKKKKNVEMPLCLMMTLTV